MPTAFNTQETCICSRLNCYSHDSERRLTAWAYLARGYSYALLHNLLFDYVKYYINRTGSNFYPVKACQLYNIPRNYFRNVSYYENLYFTEVTIINAPYCTNIKKIIFRNRHFLTAGQKEFPTRHCVHIISSVFITQHCICTVLSLLRLVRFPCFVLPDLVGTLYWVLLIEI